MKRNIFSCMMLTIFLLGLSGCGRLIDWGQDVFHQGSEQKQFSDSPRNHIRSVTAYDEFTTLGMFDVMWLSGNVRTAYANALSLKHGKGQERHLSFLRRQLAESEHFISFYLLVPYGLSVTHPDPEWSLLLKINEELFMPAEIKPTELSSEYKAFFGRKFNRFKSVYLVRFDARDAEDKLLLNDTVLQFSLVIRSVKKEVVLTWHLDDDGNLLPAPINEQVGIHTVVRKKEAA